LQTINQAITNQQKEKLTHLISKHSIMIGSYRGLHFKPEEIGKTTRRQLRTQTAQSTYYADAVLKAANTKSSPTPKLQNKKRDKPLKEHGKKVAQGLKDLEQSGPIIGLSHRFKDKPYLYNNLLHYTLEAYTLSRQSISPLFEYLKRKDLLPESLSLENPILSCSQRVRHAWRYACGLKEKKTEEGLDPTYDESGKPHHPHMGKIIIALIDYTQQTSHYADIGQLARHGQIALKEEHIVEQENCFYAYMPTIGIEPIIRYPNLALPWKSYMQFKYGLEKNTYTLCQDVLKLVQPQSLIAKAVQKLIAEIMCLSMEPKIQALAQREARKKGSILAYAHADGLLSDKPPLARLFIKGDRNKEQRTHIHHLNHIRLNLAQEQVEKTTLTDSEPIIPVDATQTKNLLNQLSDTHTNQENSTDSELEKALLATKNLVI